MILPGKNDNTLTLEGTRLNTDCVVFLYAAVSNAKFVSWEVAIHEKLSPTILSVTTNTGASEDGAVVV